MGVSRLGAILAPSGQTLVISNAAGDGPGYIVKIPQQQESVVAVDEADFDERSRHRCAAQDGERWPGEDAAVLESLVERVERAVQLVLDGAGKLHAGGIGPIAEGLAASAAASVDVDGEEQVGSPCVRNVDDTWIRGTFADQVVALEYADFLADGPEVSGHLVADPACETVLAKSIAVEVRVDCSRELWWTDKPSTSLTDAKPRHRAASGQMTCMMLYCKKRKTFLGVKKAVGFPIFYRTPRALAGQAFRRSPPRKKRTELVAGEAKKPENR